MAVNFKKSIEAEVKNTSIAKYAGVKDGQDIVCIISDEHTWDLQSHYIEGYGSFSCFRGQCCVDYPKLNVSYIYPLLKYKMTGNGLDYTKPVEFMYLKASKDLYSKIQMFEKTGGILPETDFLFHCKDAGFQKIEISEIKNKTGAKWKQDKELVTKVKEFIKSYELLIENAVKVKPMDAEKYEGLYDSVEYHNAMESYQKNKLIGNGNNYGNSNIKQGYGQQNQNWNQKAISAPVAPAQDIVVAEEDFDSLLDV